MRRAVGDAHRLSRKRASCGRSTSSCFPWPPGHLVVPFGDEERLAQPVAARPSTATRWCCVSKPSQIGHSARSRPSAPARCLRSPARLRAHRRHSTKGTPRALRAPGLEGSVASRRRVSTRVCSRALRTSPRAPQAPQQLGPSMPSGNPATFRVRGCAAPAAAVVQHHGAALVAPEIDGGGQAGRAAADHQAIQQFIVGHGGRFSRPTAAAWPPSARRSGGKR